MAKVFYPSNPASPFVSNAYDTLGRVAQQTNANGATWSYFFAGYRSEEDDPFGTRHVLYYNPRGKVQFDLQDEAGLGLLTKTLYDGLDRPSLVTLPEGGTIGYSYDTAINPWANNVASVTRNPKPGSPLSTSFTYDLAFNKPISVTDPRGLVTAMAYDSRSGNPILVVADTATLKATTRYTYTALGLPLTVTDPVGTVTQYGYDGTGNRTSMVQDAGAGRLTLTTAIAYDTVGNAVILTDPRGNVTANTWDAARRLLTTTGPATSAAPAGLVTANSYDADGRLLQVRQSAGGSVLHTTSTSYTPTGQPATITDANGSVTAFAYDLLDRRTTMTDPMKRVTEFTYDALSRPYQTVNRAIQAAPLLEQAWSGDGLRASLKDANGNTTTFAYDGFDRLATTTYPGGSTETYSYDADSNVLTRKTRANGTITYTYDTLNCLNTKTPPSPSPS